MRKWAVRGGVFAFSVVLAAVMGMCLLPTRQHPGKPQLLPTPPMGWSSWNAFGCAIDEAVVRETADVLAGSGMSDLGYRYVNVDDCWMAPQRGPDGRLQADPVRFPSGMAALADYVHARGLKFGLYQSAGIQTCQDLPGSLGHEVIDAQTFASWGVDLLKYDNCHNLGRPAVERYSAMAAALQASGRDIVFAICEWGDNKPWTWAADIGAHSWRTYGDITDTWASVLSILDKQVGLERYSGPDAWNDPDMLEVGNGGMTYDENRAQVSLWALLNAPLIAGNDLRSMTPSIRSLLTNPDVIAVNQDWSGLQGHRIAGDGTHEVWAKPMSSGSVAVVLFNRGEEPADVATTIAALGLPDSPFYTERDLWSGTARTTATGVLTARVPGHGVEMFIVTA